MGVEFRILGPVEVSHEGRPVALGGTRERAVLALLLASANRVVSAERLVEDLWCGEPPTQAVQTLRVFVSRLRKALRDAGADGVVVTQGPGYLVRLSAETLDAARFEALVSDARQHATDGAADQAAATLREALALWRGPALADVADGPLARAEAARLEEARLVAIEERVEADLACGRHSDLIAELDGLTRDHPLRERLWGQRMLALYRSGRQVEALRAYQDLRHVLVEEAGLEPSHSLAALETAILQQAPHLEWQPPTASAPASSAPVFAARTPYVGREGERDQFTRLLEEARGGRGSLVLIGGEPGVGKTRLTEETGAEAAGKGALVLLGRCYEIDGAPPYVPFVEILDQALAAAPSSQAFRAVLGDDAPEVAKLLPRLRRLFPDIPPPVELPPEQERFYLFNSLRDFFGRAAAERPLLLVFDDLHWADEGTLLLLEHLADGLADQAVLALGTYRDTEVTPDHRLARCLEDLRRRHVAQQMSLKRLSEAGVALLLQALSGQEPPASFVGAVHAETEGNPFFTEEVFKHLAEEGRLYDDDGRLRSEVTIGQLDVPESLRLVLGRRLERLGENGRRALAAAAVVGRAFTYELLEALDELQPETLLGALDEAERARLIAPLSDAPDEDRLLFSHELIRQTLLAGLSQPRRRRLHLLVAETLERLHAPSLDEQASEIAHHLAQSGPAADHRRLLSFLELAGRQAMRTADYEDALRHFESAVAMADWAEPPEQADLFAQRGLARRCVGRLEDALSDWEEALRRYEDLGKQEDAARVCLEGSRDLTSLNRDREAFKLAERGLDILGDRETPQRVELLGFAGMCSSWVSPFATSAALVDEAVALAERLGDERVVGYALVTRAIHRFAFGLLQEVLEAGQEGRRLLRAQGGLWEVCLVLAFMEAAAIELGRIDLAGELGEEVETLGSRLGHTVAAEVIHAGAVAARHLLGTPDFDAFEACARRHLEVAGPIGYRHLSATLLAVAAYYRGDWDGALQWAEDAVGRSPENHGSSGPDWACYLRVLAYSGRSAEVHAVLDDRRAVLPRPGRPNGYGTWYLPSAAIEALSVIGERDRAASFYPLVQEFMATTGVVLHWFCPILLERIAGIGAAAGGQWDLAEQHFRTALRQAEELPFELEGAETRRWYARMLLDRNSPGDRERARSLVEEAFLTYRRIGMPRHEGLARDILAG